MNTKIKEIKDYLITKNSYISKIISNTSYSINIIKSHCIFSNNDILTTNATLTNLFNNSHTINKNINDLIDINNTDNILNELQNIVNKLSSIIKDYGTINIEDMLYICFGNDDQLLKFNDDILLSKYDLINKYISPIGYKIINWNSNITDLNFNNCYCNNKTSENITSIEKSNILECFIPENTFNSLYYDINGIQFVIHNNKLRKTIIINGILNEIPLECCNNKYISLRKNELLASCNKFTQKEKDLFLRIIKTLTIKELLIYGNEDIYKKMIKINTEVKKLKNNNIEQNTKYFLGLEKKNQRELIINLLIYGEDSEVRYICKLLYDLIENNNTSDSNYLFINLPHKIQEYFNENIKITTQHKQDIINKFNVNKISLEEQLYLLKVNDNIKEKAITKLKEITGKPDELCFKTKQYLEGLIKIPFGCYKHEPILNTMNIINTLFFQLLTEINSNFDNFVFKSKRKYTNVEIYNNIILYNNYLNDNIIIKVEKLLINQKKIFLINLLKQINILQKNNKELCVSINNSNKSVLISKIIEYFNINIKNILPFICKIYDSINTKTTYPITNSLSTIDNINNKIKEIETTINDTQSILDESIYGHLFAKKQIMKVIGQWMNGEQSGYCFGFEGSPGIGKTSLAKKGLTNCLKDENNNSRPFSLIALGGSCNGSSLEGHGFTYMNSTWGKIIDILMESKCMNPIIYIDELDKVSNTEQGKEIIGILTHLIDPTQNDCFQDKYFTGIDIDLSKALFIFSYNDPDKIDKVLLDRIHRIKFDNLSIKDKIIIVKQFLLPEINKKMGFENIVIIDDDMIEYIIDNYTLESGVRKLKEILFDLFGEINLQLLKPGISNIPININKNNLENIFLTKHNKIHIKTICDKNQIGIINGLWANNLGMGGIIPIQSLFYPSSVFLNLQLTGLQGDVMKESMNVAKSIAWNLINDNIKTEWLTYFSNTKCQGLHIHCPDGGISKDGPSAGAAITTAIYSLLTKKPIKNTVGITGEINLNGDITAIGGLEYKINGGIKAGITIFLYPKSNSHDFIEWKKKNNENSIQNIKFIEITNINEIFTYVFE
jgi:ATP-dependent Lon protease